MSVPTVGTRVQVQLFSGDLLMTPDRIMVEPYPDLEAISVVLSDGNGVKVAITGDRSSVRMALTGALVQIPPEQAPEPPEEPSS